MKAILILLATLATTTVATTTLAFAECKKPSRPGFQVEVRVWSQDRREIIRSFESLVAQLKREAYTARTVTDSGKHFAPYDFDVCVFEPEDKK